VKPSSGDFFVRSTRLGNVCSWQIVFSKLPKCRAINFPQQIDQMSRNRRPMSPPGGYRSRLSVVTDYVVPQTIIRSPRMRPGEFVLVDAKRLLTNVSVLGASDSANRRALALHPDQELRIHTFPTACSPVRVFPNVSPAAQRPDRRRLRDKDRARRDFFLERANLSLPYPRCFAGSVDAPHYAGRPRPCPGWGNRRECTRS
jgi:hypothetical protein